MGKSVDGCRNREIRVTPCTMQEAVGALHFDVAFSYAGPHRDKVRAIAALVAARLGKDRVFFDEWYEPEILGDDMDVLLQRFYHEQSLLVVAELSEEYAGRPWCQAEARAIRALRFEIDSARDETQRLRLLNVRLGAGSVPGVCKTTGYLDGINKTVEECVDLILRRLALLRARLAQGQSGISAEQPSSSPSHPATAAAGLAMTEQPSVDVLRKVPGRAKNDFCDRLGDDWQRLADELDLTPADKRQIGVKHGGTEGRGIWEWLEIRKQLARLAPACRAIDRADLADALPNDLGVERAPPDRPR